MKSTWFTADTHFGHSRIIKLVGRPFSTVQEMDEEIVERWNVLVKGGDTVWHLGDFSFGHPSKYVKRLNGTIKLCLGNHDHRRLSQLHECIDSICEVALLEAKGFKIWLSHYAHRVWPSKHRGTLHLYGHSHGTLKPFETSMDVGVDTNKFKPYHFDEVVETLRNKPTWDTMGHL